MTTYQTAQASGRKPMPTPIDQAVVAERMKFKVDGVALGAGDIIELGVLPAGCLAVDLAWDSDALGGVGADATVGILNAAGDGIEGDAWGTVALETSGAGRAESAGLKAMSRVESDPNENRKLAMKVGTTATTATSGEVGVTLYYRAN